MSPGHQNQKCSELFRNAILHMHLCSWAFMYFVARCRYFFVTGNCDGLLRFNWVCQIIITQDSSIMNQLSVARLPNLSWPWLSNTHKYLLGDLGFVCGFEVGQLWYLECFNILLLWDFDNSETSRFRTWPVQMLDRWLSQLKFGWAGNPHRGGAACKPFYMNTASE